MPVSINFDKAISEQGGRAARRSRSTSSSGQQVVGHWFNDNRLDFRPQDYWKAGSKVTLKLDLDGVEGAPGVNGIQDKTVTFNVGRSQVSTVDTKTHMMTVIRDGQTVKTIPISAGSPDHPTYNGQMVISEKFKETRMNGATVGFTKTTARASTTSRTCRTPCGCPTPAPSSTATTGARPSVFGSANTSHGCIGLKDVKGGKDGKHARARGSTTTR